MLSICLSNTLYTYQLDLSSFSHPLFSHCFTIWLCLHSAHQTIHFDSYAPFLSSPFLSSSSLSLPPSLPSLPPSLLPPSLSHSLFLLLSSISRSLPPSQGCVAGNLLFNSQSLMFRPDPSCPLVQEKGAGVFEILLPLGNIVHVVVSSNCSLNPDTSITRWVWFVSPHDLKLQLCDSFKYSITRYTIMICDRAWEKGANAALSRFVQYTKISIELIVGDN